MFVGIKQKGEVSCETHVSVPQIEASTLQIASLKTLHMKFRQSFNFGMSVPTVAASSNVDCV